MMEKKKLPQIPLSGLPHQVDAAIAFCELWGGPVALESDNRKVVLLPLEYYLAHCCTEQEAAQLREELCCKEKETEEGTECHE